MIGRIISQGIMPEGYAFTVLTTESEPIDKLSAMDDKMLVNVKITRSGSGRSLDANAYYWVLVNKLAKALHTSSPWMHNHMLIKYGTLKTIQDQLIRIEIPDNDEFMEDPEMHLYPSDELSFKDDIAFRTFYLIKGSHEYTSAEMQKLIEGTVSDAQDAGIETATPAEIAELEQKWGELHDE